MREIVVFDLDDTLYPEADFVRSGFRAAGAWLEKTHGHAGLFEAAWRLHEQGVRERVFDQALTELGRPADPQIVTDLVQAYRGHAPSLRLFEDAAWALDTFRARAPIALLTDGFADVQRRKVDALGIGGMFEAMIFSDDYGREAWKPSERPYREIMKQFVGDTFVYVGDNPRKDFVTARVLGWRTVCVRRAGGEYRDVEGPGTHQADVTVKTLLELPA